MKFNKFEEILVWQKANELIVEIYKTIDTKYDYSFKDQIRRAAISIANNIAEGFERQGNKEFKKFLYIAKGSCGEVRSMLYSAKKLKYISQDDYELLFDRCIIISKMLSALIKKLS